MSCSDGVAAHDPLAGLRRIGIDEISCNKGHRYITIVIDATLEHRLSHGLVESTNTRMRLLTRMAFGFTPPEAMIALAMLNLGGYRPPLPGRQIA